MKFFATPMIPSVDLNDQSVEVPNSGGARQSRLVPIGEMIEFPVEDAKTIFDVMPRGLKLSDDGPCLGHKISQTKYSFLKYSEVIEKAYNFGFGLVKIGMEPGQSSFIGIQSLNCVEWILTEQACYSQSAIIVPVYETLGPQACSFIINQAEIKILVLDKIDKVSALMEIIEDIPLLKHIILIQEVNDSIRNLVQSKGLNLYSFQEIEELGAKNPVPILPPKPSDISTICYTSGTTGNPKGVILTHANFMADVGACAVHLGASGANKNDVLFSLLPLAHMLERLCEVYIFMLGGSIGYNSGDLKLIVEDIQALKPTMMVVVPRILNKIHDKIQSSVKESYLKSFLFNLALRMKKLELERFIIRNDSFWDRYVFKKVRDTLGGRLQLMVCGSAPLDGNILTFFRCALGCVIAEGYGQSENVAPATISVPGDYNAGHVGVPIPCCHVKLVDVPEMEYFSENKEGEVCIKGYNVFKGYFKDPIKTAETLDSDGWLHTGDIGMWLPNGTLKIIDRKKNIFKLAQGEYIAPEKIENIYLLSQYIAQIFVVGESLQSYLVAIVIPEEESIMKWCKENGIDGSFDKICKNEDVKKFILNELATLGKKASLKSFEQVKDIFMTSQLLSIENGLMTPTLKTKRPACKKFFMKEINKMYNIAS